jgi:hypothetical protein
VSAAGRGDGELVHRTRRRSRPAQDVHGARGPRALASSPPPAWLRGLPSTPWPVDRDDTSALRIRCSALLPVGAAENVAVQRLTLRPVVSRSKAHPIFCATRADATSRAGGERSSDQSRRARSRHHGDCCPSLGAMKRCPRSSRGRRKPCHTCRTWRPRPSSSSASGFPSARRRPVRWSGWCWSRSGAAGATRGRIRRHRVHRARRLAGHRRSGPPADGQRRPDNLHAARQAAGVPGCASWESRGRWIGRSPLLEVDVATDPDQPFAAVDHTCRQVERAVLDAVPHARYVR